LTEDLSSTAWRRPVTSMYASYQLQGLYLIPKSQKEAQKALGRLRIWKSRKPINGAARIIQLA